MTIYPKVQGVLYHYTSHRNFRSIVEERRLRISHVYYMNDANEIRYGANLFKEVVTERRGLETKQTLIEFLTELREWIDQLIGLPHYIFAFSLTEDGNLLSQWRAYTPSSESGVSIGFSKAGLERIAAQKGFELLKCLYDANEQIQLLKSGLDSIVTQFLTDKPSIDGSHHAPNQKYLYYFPRYSESLLKSFCQIKDPFFAEEREWRLVSKYYQKYTDPEIKFREGQTTLIPFIEFPLSGIHEDGRIFEQVYVGPSSNFNLAFHAVSNFLSNKGACNVTINSQSPHRTV